jgi:hypothetical protein
LEVPAPRALIPLESYTRKIKQLLSTVTSPVFAEIVVVFTEREVDYPQRMLSWAIQEFCTIKESRAVFCLEALDESRAIGHLHTLMLKTEEAAVTGVYDFLARPPLVFSRRATKYDRSTSPLSPRPHSGAF